MPLVEEDLMYVHQGATNRETQPESFSSARTDTGEHWEQWRTHKLEFLEKSLGMYLRVFRKIIIVNILIVSN